MTTINSKAHDTNVVEIDGKKYFTRYWMMNEDLRDDPMCRVASKLRHHTYYEQLVTPGVMALVRQHFHHKWDKLVEAYREDPDTAFNHPITHLREWDLLSPSLSRMCGRLITQLEYKERPKGKIYWAPYLATCIGKTALRLMIMKELNHASE